MTRLPVLALLSAAMGWAVFDASGPHARPWFGALLAGVAAAEAAATRSDAEPAPGSGRWELSALVLGVPLLHLMTGGGGVLGPETAAGWVISLLAWTLARWTLADLAAVERGLDGVDAPLARIRGRFMGAGLVTIAAAAYAPIGLEGLVDLHRTPSHLVPWPALIYLAIGLPAVGRVAREAHRAAWRRDGAQVDPEVSRRWTGAAGLLATAVVAAALMVPAVTRSVTGLPVRAAASVDGLGSWLEETFEWVGRTTPDAAPRPPGDVVSPSLDRSGDRPGPPGWLGDAALIVLVALVFGYAIVRGRNGRPRKRRVPPPAAARRPMRPLAVAVWAAIRALLRGLVSLIAALGRLPRRLGKRSGPATGPPPIAPAPGLWLPDDAARRRIVRAHRSFTGSAGGVIGPRGRAETAAEFGRRVEPLTILPGEIHRLTALYEEARYSVHRLGDHHADRAEEAAMHLIEDLGRDRDIERPG